MSSTVRYLQICSIFFIILIYMFTIFCIIINILIFVIWSFVGIILFITSCIGRFLLSLIIIIIYCPNCSIEDLNPLSRNKLDHYRLATFPQLYFFMSIWEFSDDTFPYRKNPTIWEFITWGIVWLTLPSDCPWCASDCP